MSPTSSFLDVMALAVRVQEEIDTGRLGAAQFAIARGGEVLHAQSFGAATDASRFVIFSATKTLTAMALLPHLAAGELELTAPVSSVIPEFGEHGKSEVTVLQLLTMQGGFPIAPLGPDQWGTSAGRRERFASWRLDWPAGSRTEYHPVAAHWVIAELIETLSGRPYAEVIHDRVTAPAGVARLLAPADLDDVVRIRTTGTHPGATAELTELFGRDDLVPEPSIGVDALLSLNHPLSQAAGIPGGGGIARAADIALVYQSFMIDDSSDSSDFSWRRDAIGTVRNASRGAIDHLPANRTIAGVIAGHDGYHHHRWFPAAPRAFGHHGAGGQICWLEPDSKMSFCFLHDTLDQDPGAEFIRCRDINTLALACGQA